MSARGPGDPGVLRGQPLLELANLLPGAGVVERDRRLRSERLEQPLVLARVGPAVGGHDGRHQTGHGPRGGDVDEPLRGDEERQVEADGPHGGNARGEAPPHHAAAGAPILPAGSPVIGKGA